MPTSQISIRPNERRHVDPAIVELRALDQYRRLHRARNGQPIRDPPSRGARATSEPRWHLHVPTSMQACPRAVQFTPPGSPTSIHLGTGPALPHYLVVNDLEAARAELISSGVDVSEVFHRGPKGRIPENWRSCGRHSEQDHALSDARGKAESCRPSHGRRRDERTAGGGQAAF
jgi:hypothetical protein